MLFGAQCGFLDRKVGKGASEMAQQIETLATKPDQLSLIYRTHLAVGED